MPGQSAFPVAAALPFTHLPVPALPALPPQLLLASGLTPEQRELGDTILESGNTLLTILGDILDFSKIDHNSMALERAPLVLRDTVEASIEMVAADARRKGLELAYCLDDALGSGRRLLGDSVRIRQVLANLLSNAVKFTAAGEVVVDAWVEGSPEEAASQADVHAAPAEAASSGATCTSLDCPPECGDESPPPPAFPRLHLTVRDTGIGIAPSAMSHLFQCFRQGHASMTRRYGGTGLGLAISRRLAHLMDGDVWVDSQEGHGSTFHFTMALHWEGETPSPSPAATSQPGSAAAALAEPAGAPAASLPRPASTSFDSSVGVSAAEALPPGRRRSSSESAHSGPRPSFAAELGDHSAPDSVSVGSASRGAEEQRQQLQAHHEALLAKLAQSSMQRPDGSPAQASEAPLTVGLSSAHSDAPDTPSMLAPGAARAGGAMSAVSSCSRLGTLTARTGSSSALAALTSLAAATTALFSDSQRGSADAQLAAVRGSRSGDSFRSSGDTGLRPPRPPPPPTADARTSTFFTSGRPLPAVQQAVGPQVQPAPSLPPPAADYRASSFFAPSQPLPPSPLCTLRPPSDEQPAVVEEAELESDAPHAPAPLQLGMQPLSPADAAAAGGASSASPAAAAHAAPGEDAVAGRRSADSQPSIASAPDPGLQRSAGGTPTGRAAAFAKAAADGLWGSAGAAAGGPDAALLRGRSVCIDVAHGPTAVQIAQSCLLLGMRATRAPCSAMAPHAEGQEFCVTTADKALEAIRAGWRGRPLVVLGRREDLPLNLQPLATTVSKPVRHARLVAALLKAAAFSRSKQQAPLHSDPAMMTAMPDRISLNRLAVNRRISLDNSALDRRRWDAATAAAATAAAVGAVAANGGDHHEPPQGSAPANGHGASLRRSGEGQPGGVGGWAPQLPAILSDDSAGESSQRSSMEGGAGGLPTIPEQPSMPGSPFAARAQRPATPEEPAALEPAGPVGHLAALEPAAPAGHDLRILVAEDNLVNQMVIRKVLQRVVPAATVEIVGNGALALEAALARRPDLILMDIHMPEMDGIEASRRLHEALPPDEAPIVVALSADTLQMQDSKCAAAGFSAFICKPFRVEDVQRVLRLVQQ
jgi:CheY-like chemotaxis protein